MSSREQIAHLFDDFELRATEKVLLRRGRAVAVEPKVLDFVLHLLENADRVVPKAELLEKLWPGLAVVDGVVHRCASRARRILDDDGRGRRLIVTRGRGGYQFVADVSSVRTLAGIDQPVGAPTGAATRNEIQFVGRSEELRSVAAILNDLSDAQRGNVLCIVGGPGMGKTRLLDMLASDAGRRGVRVLSSPCREVSGAPPFHPWIRILHDLATGTDGVALLEILGSAGADLAELVPGIASAPPRPRAPAMLSPDQQRSRFLAGAERLLQLAAQATPTVVVIDDLHCGDEATLAFWQMLLPTCSRVPLLLACGYRSAEARRRGLLAAIDAEGFSNDRVTRLELTGLSQSETELLVSPFLKKSRARLLCQGIHERSEGNPFFALELAKHANRLESQRGLEQVERVLDRGLPTLSSGIRSVLNLRIDAMSGTTRGVLEAASTIGRDFELSMLRAIDEHGDDDIDAALDEAVKAEVVDHDTAAPGRYRFRHILLRDVLYDECAPAARRRRHRRIGDHILATRTTTLEDHLEELSWHFLEAAPDGCADEAVAFALRAAEQSTHRLAFEDAALCYQRAITALALTQPESGRRQCEIVLEMADSWNRAGHDERAGAAFREAAMLARQLREPELFARAAIGQAVRFGQPVDFGVPSRGDHELLEEALAGLADHPGTQRALVLACLAFSHYASSAHARASAMASRSEAEARAAGDPFSICVALVARHLVSLEPGNPSHAADIADDLVVVAENSGMQDMVLVGHTYRVFRCFEDGRDAAELDMAITARSRVATNLRQPQGDWWSRVIGASAAMMRGDWRSCDEQSRAAHELALRSTNANQDLAFRTQQMQVLMHRGEIGAMLELSRQTWELYPHLHTTLAAHRVLLAAVGERDEATTFAQGWHGKVLADTLQASNWLVEAACLVELASRLDDPQLAEPLYRFLEPHRDRNVIVGQGIAYNGPVTRLLALLACVLGRHEAAAQDFEFALRRGRDFSALPWIARIQVDYARSLRKRGLDGDDAKARALLSEAHEIAHQTGGLGLQLEIQLVEDGIP